MENASCLRAEMKEMLVVLKKKEEEFPLLKSTFKKTTQGKKKPINRDF